MLTGPLHCGVKLYQTSGVLTEDPHGVGMRLPPGVGVAPHNVVPQLVTPDVMGMAFTQRSLTGAVVLCVARRRNQPVAPAKPDTRMR